MQLRTIFFWIIATGVFGPLCVAQNPTPVPSTAFTKVDQGQLETQLLNAELEYEQLLTQYGKEHPKVKAIQRGLEFLRRSQHRAQSIQQERLTRITSLLDVVHEEIRQLQLDKDSQSQIEKAWASLFNRIERTSVSYSEKLKAKKLKAAQSARAEQLVGFWRRNEAAELEKAKLQQAMLLKMQAQLQDAEKQAHAQLRRAEEQLAKAQANAKQKQQKRDSDLSERVGKVESELAEIKGLLRQLIDRNSAKNE